ncbi:MAG: TRAP transporter substrate-binding protein, partial [Oxalobacteraceae bacterium]
RKILIDAANEAKPYQRRFSREAEAKALDTIKAAGLKVNELAPGEIERMHQKVQPVSDKFARDAGEGMANDLRDQIAKVRGEAPVQRQ